MKNNKITSFFTENIWKKLSKKTQEKIAIYSLTGHWFVRGPKYYEKLRNKKIKEYMEGNNAYTIPFISGKEDLEALPSTLESLTILGCTNGTSLSDLPKICPNLKVIVIDSSLDVESLSFLLHFSGLQYIKLNGFNSKDFSVIHYLNAVGINCDSGPCCEILDTEDEKFTF